MSKNAVKDEGSSSREEASQGSPNSAVGAVDETLSARATPGGRRGFLLGAGAAAGAVGAAAVALKARQEAVAPGAAEVAEPKDPVKSRGYHETAHVRKYYDTTRV